MLLNNTDFIMYRLKKGDTLYGLARAYNTSVREIISANPGVNPKNLRVGDTINIPKTRQPYNYLALHDTWRRLWEQHIAWTRMAILSDVFNSPDLTATVARLMKNPSDMAQVIRSYYGDANASKFEALIRDHLQIAAELVNAAKAGNSEAAARIEKRWYANADSIALFLSSLNMYWPQAALKDMLYKHLALTKNEAVAILNNNFDASARLYDAIEQEALEMADAFTEGIVKQFLLPRRMM